MAKISNKEKQRALVRQEALDLALFTMCSWLPYNPTLLRISRYI